MGYIKPIVELPKKKAQVKNAPKQEAKPVEKQAKLSKPVDSSESKQYKKSEYINKKNKSKVDNQSN